MPDEKMKRLTVKELLEFDGQEGRPAYTAFEGKIYDVSGSRLWKNGKHSARHLAGEDLTERMVNAPHDKSKLERFPVVGELVEENPRSRLVGRLQEMHPHPIVVHFSEVLPILGAFFAFVFVVQGDPFFENISFLLILLSGFSSFGCMATGLFSWTVSYESRLTNVFSRKIVLSIILTVMITVLLFWRTFDPDVLTGLGDLSGVYLVVVLGMVPVATLLGHYGGKIVYG